MSKIISKKALCLYFDFYSKRSGKIYTKVLRNKVFTDEFLAAVGITVEQYNATKYFTALQSQRIADMLRLEKDELAELRC